VRFSIPLKVPRDIFAATEELEVSDDFERQLPPQHLDSVLLEEYRDVSSMQAIQFKQRVVTVTVVEQFLMFQQLLDVVFVDVQQQDRHLRALLMVCKYRVCLSHIK